MHFKYSRYLIYLDVFLLAPHIQEVKEAVYEPNESPSLCGTLIVVVVRASATVELIIINVYSMLG